MIQPTKLGSLLKDLKAEKNHQAPVRACVRGVTFRGNTRAGRIPFHFPQEKCS